MNPSLETGLLGLANLYDTSLSRMRKEWLCDPWSNWTESGKDENALHEKPSTTKKKKNVYVKIHLHIFRIGGRQRQWGVDTLNNRSSIQVEIHWDRIMIAKRLVSPRKKHNAQSNVHYL